MHQVCVQALPSPISVQESAQQSPPWINTAWSGVHTQKLAAFIEFRTLPIGTFIKTVLYSFKFYSIYQLLYRMPIRVNHKSAEVEYVNHMISIC